MDIRLLLVLPSAKRGGVPFTALKILTGLPSGFVCDVVVPRDGDVFEPLAAAARKIHPLPLRGFFPSSLIALRRLIRAERIDVVYAMGRGAGLYCRLAAAGTPARVVYGYHGFSYSHFSPATGLFYRLIERALLVLTDKIVCVSHGERASALAARALIAGREVVIPNGIDLSDYTQPRRAGKGFIVGTLSRISVQKDLETLVEAAALLRPRYPGLQVLIAGGTQPDEAARELRLKNRVEELQLSDCVRFVGETKDVPGFLASLDVYASASLWEGLPGAILEAFAAGVPVVATDVTGNNELVRNEETGLLTPVRDPRATAAALARVFEDRAAANRRALAARRLVETGYSIEAMTSGYTRLYRELLRR